MADQAIEYFETLDTNGGFAGLTIWKLTDLLEETQRIAKEAWDFSWPLPVTTPYRLMLSDADALSAWCMRIKVELKSRGVSV